MELRMLGSLRLEGHPFAGVKSLALLAYVALEGAQDRSLVSELFWRDSRDPRNRLSSTLTRLRNIDPDLFDADDRRVWTELPTDVERMLAAAERGDHEAVVELYSGPFLGRASVRGSVELEEWIFAKREHVASVARSSLLAIARLEAAEGRFYVAAKHAERALRLEGAAPAEPDEFLTMYSLLLAGDHVFAKEAKREATVDPDDLPSTAVEARRRLARISEASLTAARERSLERVPHTGGIFLGRDEEMARARALLADPACRLLSLVGPGGIGKTRLAAEIASDAERDNPDGACFVSLVSVTEPSAVVDAVADSLGVPLGDRDPETQLLRSLKPRRMLLVLDNFEHVLEASGLVARIVQEAPRVDILVTTRERLGLRSEWVFPLGGLSYPGPSAPLPSEPRDPAYGAPELFEQAARKVQRDFRLDSDSFCTVLRICRAVGGMPLALELAAGWLDVLPLADIASEVERGLDVLEMPAEDIPARHRRMRDVFTASWVRLSPGDRRAAASLAVFTDSFARAAAQFVAEADDRALRRLMSRSFLQRDGDRYTMHELVRQFAAERLQDDHELQRRAEHRHATYYLEMMEGWMPRFQGPEQRDHIGKMLRDLPNLLLAWHRAWSEGFWEAIARGAVPLSVLLHHASRTRLGVDAFSDAFARFEEAEDAFPEDVQISILAAFASFNASARSRLDEAEAATAEALRRFEAAEGFLAIDPMCHPHFAGVKLALVRGDNALARRHAEAYFEAVSSTHPGRGPVCARAFLGLAWEFLGEIEKAGEHYRAGYAVALETGEVLHAENYANLLGNHALARGDLDEAEAYYAACLSTGEKHDLLVKRMEGLQGLYEVSLRRGDMDEAERRIARLQPVAERLGFSQVLGALEAATAEIHLHHGRYAEAGSCLSEALNLVWTGHPGWDLSPVFAALAGLFERLGHRDLHTRMLRWVAGHPAGKAEYRARARERLGDPSGYAGGAEDTAQLVRDARLAIAEAEIAGEKRRTDSDHR